MKYLDYIITFIIIFLAVFYIIKRFKKKPINPACIGCPYAENGICSLNKDISENVCDIEKLKSDN